MSKLTSIKHYTKQYVKAYYAKHGKQSGLNPGVLWPRKEELLHMKQYEQAFCPSLEHLVAENTALKEEKARLRKEREEEVYRNLQKLPDELAKFFDKIEEKKQEKAEYLRKKEALVEEVREILGYRAKPTDERFLQALQQKEEEELKAKRKEARKKREAGSLENYLTDAKAA